MSMTLGRGTPSDPAEGETPDDKDLVLAFQRGEDGSYQAIYERYSARVSGVCSRMLDQSQDAEEAQQETFMRVYTSLPKFNGRYQLGAWVSRIATNVCLDHIRSKGRKPADTVDHETLADLSSDPTENGPEEALLRGDEHQRVRQVLATLAPNHRAALALREFEGMSYDDIAVALNMTEPQVKALIHRARKAFKKQWGPGVAAFLPWRFVARLRRFANHYDAPPHVSEAAASSMHVASSCSVALQHCGQFVTERVLTTMTALVVGTATVGMIAAPSGEERSPKPANQGQTTVASPIRKLDLVEGRIVTRSRETNEEEVTSLPPEEKPEQQPSVAAEPQPEPTSTPTTPPPSEPKPAATPPAKAPTESKPTSGTATQQTYFGWGDAESIPAAQPRSSSLQADCDQSNASHNVETSISHAGVSYPLSLELAISASTARLRFAVTKDGRSIKYSSWGAEPTTEWTHNGNEARVEITGAYGALAGYDAEGAKLPQSGHFHATLTLDCAAQSVVTEGAAFTAE